MAEPSGRDQNELGSTTQRKENEEESESEDFMLHDTSTSTVSDADPNQVADSGETEGITDEDQNFENGELSGGEEDAESEPDDLEWHNEPANKETELYKYLEKCNNTDGRSLVNIWDKRGFSKRQRSRLVRLILESEKNRFFKEAEVTPKTFCLPKEKLEQLANLIAETFPGETAVTYFSPFRKIKGGGFVPASGRFVRHLEYLNKKLRADGLLSSAPQEPLEDNILEITDEEEADIIWLETNSPKDQKEAYLLRWDRSLPLRQRFLKEEGLSCQEYLERFLGLRLQFGKQLILRDFAKLQPGKVENFSKRLHVAKACLKHYLKSENCRVPLEDRGLLSSLDVLPSSQQQTIIVYLLPAIIPQRRLASKRKNNRTSNEEDEIVGPKKFSLEERRNSFILNVLNARNIDREILLHSEKLRKKNITVQPFIVVVGPLASPQDYFVVVNKTKYKCDNISEAIQTAFQMFFAFDAAYPAAAETIWLFFQTVVFDINLPTDRPTDVINVLKGLIESKLKDQAQPSTFTEDAEGSQELQPES